MTTWKITLVSDSEQLLGAVWQALRREFVTEMSGDQPSASVDVGATSFPSLLLSFDKGIFMGKMYRMLIEQALKHRALARVTMIVGAGTDRHHLIKVWE